MLDYNVWQNDFNRYSCTRIHKKFYAFKKATRPFFTGRSCKNRINGMSRSFVQKCMNKGLHMNPINKF